MELDYNIILGKFIIMEPQTAPKRAGSWTPQEHRQFV